MNKLYKLFLAVIATIIAFFPTEIYVIIYHSLGPLTFWEMASLGLGFFFGGAFQVFLLGLLVAFLVWLSDF
jgi:hypothetical protein